MVWQLSAISNLVGRSMRGVQISGISNINGNNMAGLSATGLVNIAGHQAQGVLVSGLTNIAGRSSMWGNGQRTRKYIRQSGHRGADSRISKHCRLVVYGSYHIGLTQCSGRQHEGTSAFGA